MRSIAKIVGELKDWEAVRRAVIRQLAAGMPATKAAVMTHKRACDRCTELELELGRARKRTARKTA